VNTINTPNGTAYSDPSPEPLVSRDFAAITRAVRGCKRASPNRQRLARRAEGYMLAHLRQPIVIENLCEEMGVSERALRYAFHDHFGASPLAYFKMQRLNAIRRHIAGMPPGTARVQEIARQWGIVHQGNFAADYRRLFGESPSDTARDKTGGG
jgi:AraC family transcriptional regulator, ethanolamine operon transcriptional activator